MTRSDWFSIWRSWRRQPGLALAIVATIAVGTGLNTTVLSFVHSILLVDAAGLGKAPSPAQRATQP